IAEGEPFSSGWKLSADLLKVRAGELDLRGEGEAHGYLRVTRSGCVAVGEVRRRPPGNVLGSVDDVLRRVETMVRFGCRIIGKAEGATIVPRLFYEGLRNQRVVVGEQPHAESAPVEPDTAQLPGNMG